MSIYGTWLAIEHPDQWLSDLQEAGVNAVMLGDDTDERDLGSPWVYQGSHVLPALDDPRGGAVEVAAIPSFITRDGRDDGSEGPKDWLRLSVNADPTTHGEGVAVNGGPDATVVLDRAQTLALRDTLTAWLERDDDEP